MTTSTEAMDARAREIMRLNDKGAYTVPTAGLYPYQWNWDSMFAALGFAGLDMDRAWQEVHTLFSGQWDSGMVPHIQFHVPDPGYFPGPDVWGTEGQAKVPSSGISQPPVAASLARRLWDLAPERDDPAQLFDKMLAWHRWFMTWRQSEGAIFVTHPWEAGRDNAPDWDSAMARITPGGIKPYIRRDTGHVDPSMRPTKQDYDRYIWLVERGRMLGWEDAALTTDAPFRVADPGMTFILLGAHRDLAEIGRKLGRDTSEIDGWIETMEKGAATLWNPETGAYDSIDLEDGAFAGSRSNASYLCWFAGIDDARMAERLDDVMGRVRYPVPSLDPASPRFDAMRYWRGPTWAIMNMLIAEGLKANGRAAQAEELRQRTCDLITENGFAEYFDPLQGTPAGGGTFTWTAAVWLYWVSPSAGGN